MTKKQIEDSFQNLLPGAVVVQGVPLDENSSFLRGAALGPSRIRQVLHAGSMNLCTENGVDLGAEPRWQDAGDLELDGLSDSFEYIEQSVTALLQSGAHILSLGGDHSITYPIVRAYAGTYPNLGILHLDAHPDLYDEFEGNRLSHACPFARIMEEKLAARLVQVGIRTMNPHQRAQAKRFAVQVIEMQQIAGRSSLHSDFWQDGLIHFEGPVYLSLDLDVLDPAFAPGVSHHEPGGLSTRQVINLIQNLGAPVVGADIVELNPNRDVQDVTAITAAKLLKEISARMLESGIPA